MFCYKCGIEIPDGAAFCHKCGTKIMSMDNTRQVVKKSQVSAGIINDVDLQESAVTPVNPVQVQQQAVTSSKTGKKKSKKGLLISGVVFMAVVILVVVMSVSGGFNKNTYSDTGVSLSRTYVNEAEGISFQYPSAWVDADITEYNNNQSVIENTVVLLVNGDDQGVDSMIHIRKLFAEQELIDNIFAEEKEFTKLFNSVSILETSITKLDGIDARMVAYVDQDSLYHLSYLYNINSALYDLDFICHESAKASFERFFDAVVESYSITTIASTAPNQNVDIYFNDIRGLSDGTVTGYQEPIDYYYELSGRYSGSVEQSVLSLSIYSSQEEGETAIGNVDISVGGILHYYGDVILSSKDIFYVETDAGGEVLLVKSTLDGVIVLQLYVDGQWIEDYRMQEHYES